MDRASGVKELERKCKLSTRGEKMALREREEALERGAIGKREEAIEKRGEGMKKTEEGMKKREAARTRYKGLQEREEAREAGAIGKREEAMEKRGEEMKKTEEGTKKTEEGMKKREAARTRYKGKGKATVFMTEAEKLKLELDNYLEWKKKRDAEKCDPMSERIRDPYAFQARSFKQRWEEIYGRYGNFSDTTSRFMLDSGAEKDDSLQVFSLKVSELTGGLQWPLDVYGLVAIRDTVDHKRNIIFERERENCQTLTVENPYLVLTGPMRAVMLSDSVVFEVSLYVRGTADSDDKELSLLAASCLLTPGSSASFRATRSYTSRLSTLVFKLGYIACSVEATITVKVISGPPHGFYGKFVAFTDNIEDGVVLHKSGDQELHLAGNKVNLSRSVVSVGTHGKLKVSVMAWDGCVNSMGSRDFPPLEKGTSSAEIEVAGLCKLEVNVDWSLLSCYTL